LVQLQRDSKAIDAVGVRVVGVSPDSVKVLKGFSDAQKIGFPLLSDPDSAAIKAFGILNPDSEGLPLPGTFLLDEAGVVRAKLFESGYKTRHSTEALIQAAKAIH